MVTLTRVVAPIDVVLTDEEVAESARVAQRRSDASVSFAQGHGYNGTRLALDLPGAAGEVAFCKAFGFCWSGSVGSFKLADVSHNIQIRTAPCRAAKPPWGFGTLIVRHDDDERDYFVLIVGNIPHFRVMGWLLGADARREKWIRSEAYRPAAWFVPNRELHKDFSIFLSDG